MAQGLSNRIISMIKWIRTSRLLIKNYFSMSRGHSRTPRRACPARALKKVTTRQSPLHGISFQKSNALHKTTPSSSLAWWGLFQKTGVGVCPYATLDYASSDTCKRLHIVLVQIGHFWRVNRENRADFCLFLHGWEMV